MRNPYTIQLVGVAVTAIGILALIAFTAIFGRPLSNEEKLRMGEEKRSLYRLPINTETMISTIIFLGGIGILTWSNFDVCAFIAYWLPNLPEAVIISFRCR